MFFSYVSWWCNSSELPYVNIVRSLAAFTIDAYGDAALNRAFKADFKIIGQHIKEPVIKPWAIHVFTFFITGYMIVC